MFFFVLEIILFFFLTIELLLDFLICIDVIDMLSIVTTPFSHISLKYRLVHIVDNDLKLYQTLTHKVIGPDKCL